ncbi:MAG: ROK family protein [Desulfurococcaceae archaeon]
MSPHYLVADVGATRTRVGIGTEEGLVRKVSRPTPREGGPDAIAHFIYSLALEEFGELAREAAAVGVGTIGPLDIRSGNVVNPPNLPIKGFRLLGPLRELSGKPVYVINDAVAGVLAELRYGSARGARNAVYITISTGIGGGVAVDGEVLIGKGGNAHEVGHFVVRYEGGLRCGCGGYGHWEAYSSGSGIPKLARALAERGAPASPLAEKALQGSLEPAEVFDAYRRGDPFAAAVIREVNAANAAGLATVINAYDPEVVTIGGAVFLNNVDVLLEPMVRGARANVVAAMPRVEPTRLGDDVVLLGALALASSPPRKLLELQGYSP